MLRAELVQSTKINRNKAHCFQCGRVVEGGDGYSVALIGYGSNGRVFCREHYGTRGELSYHANASNGEHVSKIGTIKIGDVESVSIGNEIEFPSLSQTARELGVTESGLTALRYALESTFLIHTERDCTVGGEIPTPPMRGLNRLSAFLNKNQDICEILNNENCGAHIHAECTKVEYVKRYYHSIFLPLASAIRNLTDEQRIEFFGSTYRGYAMDINEHSEPSAHSNIFNTQHSKTLEFRLPRICNGTQYIRVCKFWREVVWYINNFDFCESPSTDREHAPLRKQKAEECSRALVEIFNKYFA